MSTTHNKCFDDHAALLERHVTKHNRYKQICQFKITCRIFLKDY